MCSIADFRSLIIFPFEYSRDRDWVSSSDWLSLATLGIMSFIFEISLVMSTSTWFSFLLIFELRLLTITFPISSASSSKTFLARYFVKIRDSPEENEISENGSLLSTRVIVFLSDVLLSLLSWRASRETVICEIKMVHKCKSNRAQHRYSLSLRDWSISIN